MTNDSALIEDAARILEAGALVAFPTETVYGLGADAENPAAVARIYAAKGRPANHPVIVHVAPQAQLTYWADSITDAAHQLIAAFWPGPLTLILQRAARIPDAVAGGQSSIGLRCPSHPVAQALLKQFKQGTGGIAAPSANRFGRISPTTASHVEAEFGTAPNQWIAAILDGGACQIGIESTIIDLSRGDAEPARLLRPGQLHPDRIAAVIGYRPLAPDAAAPRVSGALPSHYAPLTPLVLASSVELPALLEKLTATPHRIGLLHRTALTNTAPLQACQLPDNANAYAHALYAALRELDQTGADLLVVEAPPAAPEWDAIRDRLQRAAHSSHGILLRLLQK